MKKSGDFVKKPPLLQLFFYIHSQIAQIGFTIRLIIPFYTFLDDLNSFLSVLNIVYDCFLMFKVFIDGKKVLHLVKNVLGKLGDIIYLVVSRVAHGNADNFLVVCAVVEHFYNAYRVALNERHRIELF